MEGAGRILVIDDDPGVRQVVEDCLTRGGFEVVSREHVAGIENLVETESFDLAIVDLVLPDGDGLGVARLLSHRAGMGVIILSGRGEPTERIVGLEVGADDYISKPFEPRELLARVRSVLRRMQGAAAIPEVAGTGTVYVFEGWRLDLDRRELRAPSGGEIQLTTGEFTMLRTFVEHPNRVLSRDQLITYTSSHDSPAFDRSIDVRIGRLRKKIENDPRAPSMIKTVRNMGYMFTPHVERA